MARMLPEDWERATGTRSTSWKPSSIRGYRGTCYRAANWVVFGRTTGRGKDACTKRPNRPIKEVLGYPLRRDFRELLSAKMRKTAIRRSNYLWKSSRNSGARARHGSDEEGYAKLKAALETLCYWPSCWRTRTPRFIASGSAVRLEHREDPRGGGDRRCREANGKADRGTRRRQAEKSGEEQAGARPQRGRAYTAPKRFEVRTIVEAGRSLPGLREGHGLRQARAGVSGSDGGPGSVGAKVYELQKLRCNLCGEVFTAEPPRGWERRSTTRRRGA